MRPFLSCTRALRWPLLAALFLFYFGSLWLGAMHFPHGYDWRRNVISNLLSPRDNPDWYWLPSAGVGLAGLCMAPLAVWIESEFGNGENPLARRLRRLAFIAGILCLILAAIVAPRHARLHPLMGIRRPHELLARTSAVGLGVGLLCACLGPAEPRTPRRTLRTISRIITFPPIAGAVASALIRLCGTASASAFLRATPFWQLAFWEWAGSAAVFLYFAAAVVILGKSMKDEL